MSRIIKFRSWNSRDKTMEFPDNIANDIDGDKYQLMQFTGLYDKQGTEIYEWDVVSIWNPPCKHYSNVIVCYSAPSYWAYFPSANPHLLDIYDLGTFYEGHVVGNIWEHPELKEPNG